MDFSISCSTSGAGLASSDKHNAQEVRAFHQSTSTVLFVKSALDLFCIAICDQPMLLILTHDRVSLLRLHTVVSIFDRHLLRWSQHVKYSGQSPSSELT